MKKNEFISAYYPLANEAGLRFGINPIVILAQAAIETGWGISTLATTHNNFFGITAYGKKNDFWLGSKTDLSEGGQRPALWFRTYNTPRDSFLDFARFIHRAYPAAASLSSSPQAYAKEIAYSKHISEVHTDNRAVYQRMLVTICKGISQIIGS